MRHHALHLAAAAVLTTLTWGLLAPASAVAADRPGRPGAGRVTFGLQPATRGRPDDRPAFRYSVTPGARLTDQVAVRNLSDVPATFAVYATDALNLQDGGFGLLPRRSRPQDVGRWLSVGGPGSRGSVTVRPRSEVVLPLSLRVPPNAQPGDHTGGVIVSLATRGRRGSTDVVLDQRVAARVFIRVSGPLRPALAVTPVRGTYHGTWNPFARGRSVVTYTVTNTGNVNLGGRQRIVVRGPVGPGQAATAVADLGLLLPGGSARFTAVVPSTTPMVRERATVSLTPLVQVGDQVPGLRTYSGSASFWAVPWAAAGVLLLLLGLASTALLLRRGRRGGRRAPVTVVDAPAPRRAGRRVGASTALAIAALVTLPTAAHAADAPYADPSAAGGITFCDSKGDVVTGGRLDDGLAAKAVAGAAAAAPYDGPTRTAGLFAYQPRQGLSAGEWSGQGMTALSRYTDPRHPAVEILPRDSTMAAFLHAYPALWDGYVQLRIFLRAAGAPTNTTVYSATSVRVSGDRWQQVGPSAGAVCGTSAAASVVRLLGLPTTSPAAGAPARSASGATPPSASKGAATTARATSSASAAPSATSGPSGQRPGSVATGGAASAAAADAGAPATSARAAQGDGFVQALVVVVVLAGVAALAVLVRNRGKSTR